MAITKIRASGFKGWSGEQEISNRTLFVGPNGAGKSARSQALQLAVNGGVIGAGKTNDDILSTFGEGDKLVVGLEIDGKYLFERVFVRGASGSVSQGYKVGGAKSSKEFFMKSMGEAGAPAVINVADFMVLSDQKKIEALFQLYPPTGDISAVQGKIDASKEKINSLTAKVKTSEQAAARIASSKSQIQVPAGTLAEVDAQIATLETEIKEARENLTQILIDEQKAADALKAQEEADRKEKERIEEEAKKVTAVSDEAVLNSLTTKPGPMEQEAKQFTGSHILSPSIPDMTVKEDPAAPSHDLCNVMDVRQSLLAIIAAMDEAGCGACAAKMVARRELRNFKEVNGNG